MSLFCKIDKIIERMFADSQNQGPSPQRVESDRYVSPHYTQKILYLGKPWSDGHISLKKFDIFQFGLSYTLYEILDFNFASASSEGSDEPVHLQNLDTVFAVLRIADEGSDKILASIFIPTHKGLN